VKFKKGMSKLLLDFAGGNFVNIPLMPIQTATLGELFGTKFATVRPIPRVCTSMTLQISNNSKPFITHVALIAIFPTMTHSVFSQFLLSAEFPTTIFAWWEISRSCWMSAFHMISQQRQFVE
jgi:hypothetical protein